MNIKTDDKKITKEDRKGLGQTLIKKVDHSRDFIESYK